MLFTVNTTVDGDDFNIGDGICDSNAAMPGEQCSLRAAIREVNASVSPGPDTIHFSIGAGAQTITPAFPLGGILRRVVIDGTTQPGFAGTPLIELNGSSAAVIVPGGDGLRLLGGASTVRGLVINRFGNNGISLVGPLGGNVVAGNYIGTNASGTMAQGNGGNGIFIDDPDNRIGGTVPGDRNVISGNLNPEVGITGRAGTGNRNIVQGNYIGTNSAGDAAIGIPPGSANQSNGVVITEGASDNLIGGPLGGIGPCELRCNLISGASEFSGITIADGASLNNVEGNYIGTDWTGAAPIPNRGGIQVVNAAFNTFGGDTDSRRNIISGNTEHGVLISGATATDNRLQRNYIGTSVTGNARLANGGDGVRIRDGVGTDVLANVISGNANGGSSLLLNGSSAFAETAPHPELSPKSWTFDVWFKDANPTYKHSRTRILTNGDIGLPEVPYFASIDSNVLFVGLRSNGAAQVVTLNLAAAGITPAAWHHLAASFDGDTRLLKIYIDGIERAAGQLAFGGAGTNLPLIVGRSGTTGNYWAGNLDDLRLWSVVRTPTEIKANFDREIVGTPPGLVGNWHFDEGAGFIAGDAAGAPQNLILQGGAGWAPN